MSSKKDTLLFGLWPFAGISMTFTLLASFNIHDWICDLIANFWLQYLLVNVLFSLVLILLQKKKELLVVFPFILLCLMNILPLYIPQPSDRKESQSKVKLLQMNVNTRNKKYETSLKYVSQLEPDIVLFEEINEKWLEELKAGMPKDYKLIEAKPQSDNFGIAMFSKIPYIESKLLELGYFKVPAIDAKFQLSDTQFTVLGAHVLPPISGQYFRERNLALDEVALYRNKKAEKRFVLIGDLNATSWSPFFKDFIKKAGLVDTASGFGIKPTWPVSLLAILGIPIDHCLVSEHFEVLEYRTGPDVGSDHLPLFVELSIVK